MSQAIVMITLSVFAASAAYAETENFDDTRADTLPPGWTCGVTGRGSPQWAVAPDASAPCKPNVLRQSGFGTFPWCVKKSASAADGFVEVKFRPERGKEDQAGGVIWRWQDGDNYHVARANALENNVSLYYTAGGRRNTLKYVDAPVPRGVWHSLRVEFAGTRIRVILNGHAAIELDDAHITAAGAVGVWTKADSVTTFDDFRYGKVQ